MRTKILNYDNFDGRMGELDPNGVGAYESVPLLIGRVRSTAQLHGRRIPIEVTSDGVYADLPGELITKLLRERGGTPLHCVAILDQLLPAVRGGEHWPPRYQQAKVAAVWLTDHANPDERIGPV